MGREMTVIGAPSSAGAYAPGQERTPALWREAGLLAALRDRGYVTHDAGDGPVRRWRPDPARPDAANLPAIVDSAREVAAAVGEALAGGSVALVIGGDCTVGVGTVAGAVTGGVRTGLVYIDYDADLNVPATGDGPLDWMGVAHMLGVPGSAPELVQVGDRRPLLARADVLLVGVGNVTPPERELVDGLGIATVPFEVCAADPAAAAREVSAWAANYDRLVVHLDVDVLEYTGFPVSESTLRRPGLTPEALAPILAAACAAPGWAALTVTEVNPDHMPDPDTMFRRFTDLVVGALPAG